MTPERREYRVFLLIIDYDQYGRLQMEYADFERLGYLTPAALLLPWRAVQVVEDPGREKRALIGYIEAMFGLRGEYSAWFRGCWGAYCDLLPLLNPDEEFVAINCTFWCDILDCEKSEGTWYDSRRWATSIQVYHFHSTSEPLPPIFRLPQLGTDHIFITDEFIETWQTREPFPPGNVRFCGGVPVRGDSA